MDSNEMIYEHKSGARLKLSQEPTAVNRKSYKPFTTWSWILSWCAPNSECWTEIGYWTKRSKHAHVKKFKESRDAMDSIEFAKYTPTDMTKYWALCHKY